MHLGHPSSLDFVLNMVAAVTLRFAELAREIALINIRLALGLEMFTRSIVKSEKRAR